MKDLIEVALEDARREKAAGRVEKAEGHYRRAAELARACRDERLLAHALRHMSDLALARGAVHEAWEQASEAVALYRRSGDQLGLANALRLQALSAEEPQKAKSCWREARELYGSLDISAGVAECVRHLGN